MYRNNVAAVIFNEDGLFLACQRMDRRGWQCVQGGVEESEMNNVRGAAEREIEEEIGIPSSSSPSSSSENGDNRCVVESGDHSGLVFVGVIPPPDGDPTKLRYDLPPGAGRRIRRQGYIGQQQTLTLFFLPSSMLSAVRLVPPANPATPDVRQEFAAVAWMTMEEFFEKSSESKRPIFRFIAEAAPPLVGAYLEREKASIGQMVAARIAAKGSKRPDGNKECHESDTTQPSLKNSGNGAERDANTQSHQQQEKKGELVVLQ